MKSKTQQISSYQVRLFVILTAVMCMGYFSKAQQPITLTYKNMLMPPTATYVYQGADINGVAIPKAGENQTWDYSKLVNNDLYNFTFSTEPISDPVFPTAFRKWASFFYVGDIAIALDQIESNSVTEAVEVGNHFPAQAISLALITGNPDDSLIIPEHDVVVSPEIYRQYPLEYGSSSTSNSVYVTDFILNIPAFGLDHVPGQFVQRVRHNSDVIGWGKLKIPKEHGSTGYIRVLLQRLNVLRTDSIYLGGAPADPMILAAFGVTQGQTVNSYYQYRFHQMGIDAYLANFTFTDDTYSTLSSVQYDARYYHVQCGNGVKMCINNRSICIAYADANYLLINKGATVGDCSEAVVAAAQENMVKLPATGITVYPNPSSGQFSLHIPYKPGSSTTALVYDFSGRQVLSFRNIQTDRLIFGSGLKPGTYIVQLIQGNSRQTIKVVKTE